ncbi:MAG: response regulator [Flavobacteriales bacterium]|nr:response regulator [Flavobacteriia bacterium]NCP05752.1 response regulator [Flavobacteriales bacterium]NCP60904.1 response regulator [Flavobacteriales bacterium]NCQ56751.1 response regulator [Flavobacteriales bacterium]
MAFLFQSMRSFKVRMALIFFTFIGMVITLFIGFLQVQKKLDYLPDLVEKIYEIKFEVSNNLARADKPLSLISQDFNTYNEQVASIKNKLNSNSNSFDSKLDDVMSAMDLMQESILNNNPDSLKIYHQNLNEKLVSITLSLKSLYQTKSKEHYNNTLLLLILTAVMMIGFVYYLSGRMTHDISKLKQKMAHPDDLSEKPLVTKIQDIKSLDKSFELLKSKLRRLEIDLDEAKKTCDYKSVFLANMSYEIRTPLNSVLGMINMLKQSELTTEQQIQLEIAEYSSEHVLQLVNMILDNSSVEGGQVELELSAIDLKSDLEKLVKVFEYEAWDKSLDFEFQFLADEKQKFLLLGDLKRIKQILTNLLSNAIKFTNAGKVSLIIDQTVGPDDYQIVTFYVKDTGIGIPPEKAKRIFSESEKNHQSIIDYYGGTGLGLTASSQLINLMGGELKLESKENEGSIFYFSIQLQKTLNLEREKAEPSSILLNEFDYKFTVLVAEDNKMNQKVIKFLLEQQGADCTFVKNGSDAVKLFNILDFDMVFMDIFMPEMDGYEATKLIKLSKKYKDHKVPIIAVSASAFDEDIQNAKAAGIDEFLAKPIETAKLRELLVKYAPNHTEAN